MRLFSILLVAGIAGLTTVPMAHAVDKATTAKPGVATKLKSATTGGTLSGGVKGGTVAELSGYECRTLGGTVITVADNRCGASQKYCKMPSGLAACIDELKDP